MAGQESDLLFGNLPPRYRALPDMKASIEDRRYEPPGAPVDYAAQMSSKIMTRQPDVGDPLLDARDIANPDFGIQDPNESAYLASYNRNFVPQTPPQVYQPPVPPALPPIPPIPPQQAIVWLRWLESAW